MNVLSEHDSRSVARILNSSRQQEEVSFQNDGQSAVLTRIPDPETPVLGLALREPSLSKTEEGYQRILKYSPAVGAIPAAIIAGMFGGGKIGLSVVSAWSERVSQAMQGENANRAIVAETMRMMRRVDQTVEFVNQCQEAGLVAFSPEMTMDEKMNLLGQSLNQMIALNLQSLQGRKLTAETALPTLRAETKLQVAQIKSTWEIRAVRVTSPTVETIKSGGKVIEQGIVTTVETLSNSSKALLDAVSGGLQKVLGISIALPPGIIGEGARALPAEAVPTVLLATGGALTGTVLAVSAGYHALTETFYIYGFTGGVIGGLAGVIGTIIVSKAMSH